MHLFKYQVEGVAFLNKVRGKGIIGDEMGLGKTIQVLAWMKIHPNIRPALIICPAVAKFNWLDEIRKWLPKERACVLSTSNLDSLRNSTYSIYIINYDILAKKNKYKKMRNGKKKRILELMWNREWTQDFPLLVLDECHYLQADSSLRTQILIDKDFGIGWDFKYRIGLSGTPITAMPKQFFNILHLINPYLFPNWWWYAMRFCNPQNNGFGWTFNGFSNLKKLHSLTRDVMIRRLKSDVQKQMPPKLRSIIPITISNRDIYEWMERKRDYKEIIPIVAFGKLRRLTAEGKIDGVISWLDNFFYSSDKKFVLFAHHKNIIEKLMQHYKKIAMKIDGTVHPRERHKISQIFNYEKFPRLLINEIKAGGVAINLIGASSVGFIEFPTHPGVLLQCEDRCHRLTQKNCVNVYLFCGRSTIDEKIIYILRKNISVVNSTLDGGKNVDFNMVKQLIELYNKEKYHGKVSKYY